MTVRLAISLRSCLLTLSLCGVTPIYAAPLTLNWNGWQLEYNVGSQSDGLSLSNVRFQDKLILGKASFPVMQAFYENSMCGPFVDRLGPANLTRVKWANDAVVVAREFSFEGQLWFELGIEARLGDYDIYQVWYLREDGVLDGLLFSKGLQCNANHVQFPYWRFDFDLNGRDSDQIRYFQGGAWHILTNEADVDVAIADGHQWQVRDVISGDYVEIRAWGSSWNLSPQTVAYAEFARNRLLARAYNDSENKGWTYGAISEEPHQNNEPIDGRNLVVWYKGHVAHSAADRPSVWHGTGVRLAIGAVQRDEVNGIPAIIGPGSQTNRAGHYVDLPVTANDPDGDILSFSATGLPASLNIHKDTGRITGVLSKAAEGTHTVTLGVSDGKASATTSFIWSVTPGAGPIGRYDIQDGNRSWRMRAEQPTRKR